MRSIRRFALTTVARCLLPWCFAPVLQAAEIDFVLDAARTQVNFVLEDVLHTVHGSFRAKNGRLTFDADKQTVGGEIVIDAASGSSGNGVRDRRMTHNILEAQRYPEIRFAPEKIAGSVAPSGRSDVQVTGSFLIHGQAHEISLPMQVQISQSDLTVTGKFTVPYVQWGMKNPSTFILKVSERVEIDLTAVAHVASHHALP